MTGFWGVLMIFKTLQGNNGWIFMRYITILIFWLLVAFGGAYLSQVSIVFISIMLTGVWRIIGMLLCIYLLMLLGLFISGKVRYSYHRLVDPVKIPVKMSAGDHYFEPKEKRSILYECWNRLVDFVRSHLSGFLARHPHIEKGTSVLSKLYSRLMHFFLVTFTEKILLNMLFSPLEYLHQKREKQFMEENPQYHSDLPHNGIIICHGTRDNHPFYGFGSDQLVHYFVEKGIPYRVYNCFTFDDFVDVVHNNSVQVMWIFGHGNRGGVGIGHSCLVYAKDIPEVDLHKKIAVYQFHCNGGVAMPLSRLVVDGWDFQEEGLNTGYKLRAHIEQILAEPDKFPGIWEPVKGKYE